MRKSLRPPEGEEYQRRFLDLIKRHTKRKDLDMAKVSRIAFSYSKSPQSIATKLYNKEKPKILTLYEAHRLALALGLKLESVIWEMEQEAAKEK